MNGRFDQIVTSKRVLLASSFFSSVARAHFGEETSFPRLFGFVMTQFPSGCCERLHVESVGDEIGPVRWKHCPQVLLQPRSGRALGLQQQSMASQPVVHMPLAVDLEKGLDSPVHAHHGRHKLKQQNSGSELRHELRIFGLKLDALPSWAKYLVLAAMVFLLSLSAAYCAELVFISAGDYDISTSAPTFLPLKSACPTSFALTPQSGWFLALFDLGIGALFGSIQKTLARTSRKGSFKEYAFLGALFLAARVLTNLSVRTPSPLACTAPFCPSASPLLTVSPLSHLL